MEERREFAVAAITSRVGGRLHFRVWSGTVDASIEDRIEPPRFAEQPVRLSYRHLLVVLAVHLESRLR